MVTYVLVDAIELATCTDRGGKLMVSGTGDRVALASFGRGLSDVQPWTLPVAAGRLGLVVRWIAMEPASVATNGVELGQVQHLAELLDLRFVGVRRHVGVWGGVRGPVVLLFDEPLQRLEVGAVFDDATDVYLCADEVSNLSSAVGEGGDHQQVHKRRAITTAE